MPTLSRTGNIDEKSSHEMLWDHFCNTPTVLSWHEKLPRGGVNRVLEKDWAKNSGRNYTEDFVKPYQNTYRKSRKSGETYKPSIPGHSKPDNGKEPRRGAFASLSLVSSEEGLTVEHETVEKSAEMLCNSRTAAGPDYVNVPEGLFCRSKFLVWFSSPCSAFRFALEGSTVKNIWKFQ